MALTVDGDAKIKTGGPNRGLLVGVDLSNSDSGLYYESTGRLHLRGRGGYPLEFNTAATAGTNLKRMDIAANGDISFYEDTGTTAKFFWDASAESLGIGTSSPTALLHLSSTVPSILMQDSDGTGRSSINCDNGSLNLKFNSNNAVGTSVLTFSDFNTERMRIDSSGNVGIGTYSPATALDVNGTVTADGLTVDGTSDLNGTVTVGTTYTTDITGNNVDFKRDNGASYVRQRGGHPLVFQTFETTDRSRINIAANGDISFYEDTGTTAKFFWDASAERLGIGGTPFAQLDVVKGTGAATIDPAVIRITSTTAASDWDLTSPTGS
jgi:hypothetical protein